MDGPTKKANRPACLTCHGPAREEPGPGSDRQAGHACRTGTAHGLAGHSGPCRLPARLARAGPARWPDLLTVPSMSLLALFRHLLLSFFMYLYKTSFDSVIKLPKLM